MTSTTLDLTIQRGKTFTLQLGVSDEELKYVTVSAVSNLAPARLTTASAHGLPTRWPVRIESVKLPLELQMAPTAWRPALKVDATTFELNDLNLTAAKAFVPPAVLVYQKPADMTGWIVRMQVRDLTTNEVLLDASSEAGSFDGVIAIDVANSVFEVTFSAAITAALAWNRAGYDIEAVLPDGKVMSIIAPSKITVEKEYTVWA